MIDTYDTTLNTWGQHGVISGSKGSFEFATIDGALYLQGGVAILEDGGLLTLPKASYKVLDQLDIAHFTNHSRYYCYIRVDREETVVDSDIICQTEIIPEYYFCISDTLSNSALILGQIEIDYEAIGESRVGAIGVPRNAFSPQKNEIDTRNIKRVKTSKCISTDEREEISRILFGLSSSLLRQTQKTNNAVLSIPSTTFFTFSQEVLSSECTPYRIFTLLQSHIALLVSIDSSIWDKKIQTKIEELKEISGAPWAYSASFYRLDRSLEEGYFSQVFTQLQEISSLMDFGEAAEACDNKNILEDLEEFDSTYEELHDSPLMVEPEDDGLSTVLLGGRTLDFVQVGRGTQSGNDIVVGENDKTVSRTHLKITRHKQGFFVEDLSSMGTYVDGTRIKKDQKKFVTLNNVITLGKKGCTLDLRHPAIQALR